MAHFLCLAYPCSVEGGVDSVVFIQQILQRRNPELRRAVRQTLGVDENIDLRAHAEGLREIWRPTVTQDRTNMTEDLQSVLGFSEINPDQLTTHPSSQVIGEIRDEQISTLRSFLLFYDRNFHRGIRLLYLIGHAISNRGAAFLRQNPAVDNNCDIWPWPLYDCSYRHGINRSPTQVTNEARQGDLVVFSSGLLTPEWVINVLREAESQSKNRINNTIVIVVDACYSGIWVERMRTALEANPLQYTRILLQTSCGRDEVAYGQLFTPQFVDLNLVQGFEINRAAQTQSPLFFDSRYPNEQHPSLPQIENFRFINTPIGLNTPIGHMDHGNVRSRNDAFCTKVPYN